MKNNYLITLFILLILSSAPVRANCTKTSVPRTGDSHTALIPFGKINLTDTYLQPVGTQLATVIVPSTNYTDDGASGASVLWQCDAADVKSVYFLVATNGDDRIGGFYDIGAANGLHDVYATWFGYVGIRQSMSGVSFSRYWKKVPLTTYATTSEGKIQIRLQDIPPLVAELYRVSTLPGMASPSHFCGDNNNDGKGIGLASPAGRLYSCNQPNSYIQLSGDSNVKFSFAHDNAGEDSSTLYRFFGANNGYGYSMRTANSLFQADTCVARNTTPLVILPAINAAALENGESSSANFSVQIECSDWARSGLTNNQTAIGFQVSPESFSAAKYLDLVNASGGVTTLVSDRYFDSTMAHGVGITLSNSRSRRMNFVGQPGTVSIESGGGKAAGWYPVLDGAVEAGSAAADYTTYNSVFTATLAKIPGVKVTPGKVSATVYVLVKMQ